METGNKIICSFMGWDDSHFFDKSLDLNHFCKAWNVAVSTFLSSNIDESQDDKTFSLYFRLKNTSPIFTIEGKINILTDIIIYLKNNNIVPNIPDSSI